MVLSSMNQNLSGAVIGKIGPRTVAISMTIRRTVSDTVRMIGAVALLEQIVIVYSVGPTLNLQHRAPRKMIEMAMVNPGALHETSAAAHSNPAVAAYNVYWPRLNVMPVSRNDFPAGIVALNNDPGMPRSFSSMMMV